MALEPGKFELTAENHKQLVANLLKRTKQFTPDSVKAGKEFYPSGQQDSEWLGKEIGGDTLSGAAILSKFSGGTDWNINRMQGIQFPTLDDRAEAQIRKIESTRAEMKAEGRPKLDITNTVKSIRAKAGLPGTPLGLAGSRELTAALDVRSGAKSPLEIFNDRRKSRKTPDFRDTLATGGQHTGAVIDTHAYDAALDSYHIPYGVGNQHLNKVGVYDFVQNAYAVAHQKALSRGLVPENTSLGDFQAMHWFHQINNKALVNQKANASAKAAITKIGNLLRNNPQTNPETKGLAPIVLSRQPHLAAFNGGMGEGR